MANLFIHRPGLSNDLPPFLIGSHLDSQPMGGRFDGALGTLSAFEVLESLEDASIQTPVPWRWSPGPTRKAANTPRAAWDPWPLPRVQFRPSGIPAHSPDGKLLGEELAATLDALPQAIHAPAGKPAFRLS